MKLGGKEGVLNEKKDQNRLIGKAKSQVEVKEQKNQDGTSSFELDHLGTGWYSSEEVLLGAR